MFQQFHVAHHGQGNERVKAGMAGQFDGTQTQVEIAWRDGWGEVAYQAEIGRGKFDLRALDRTDCALGGGYYACRRPINN